MRAALAMGGVDPEDVDYVNGHGTGTPANDAVEPKAIAQLRNAPPPPFSSTKSMVGHTLGAAGAIEAVTCTLALEHQLLPPTVVPAADLPWATGDIVPNTARPARIRNVLSNSFAFGGNNASLLVRAAGEPDRQGLHARADVVITGIGAIAGNATDTAAVRRAFLRGEDAYGDQTAEVDDYGRLPTAEIPHAAQQQGINPSHVRRMDALGRRGAVAVGQLLAERRLSRDELATTGLLFATGTGPISTVEAFERELIETGSGNSRLFPNTVMNAAAGHVALLHRIQGPTATICSGGISGVTALHFAMRLVARGAADRMIVLAADEAPAAMLAAYARIDGYLSRSVSRPYQDSGRLLGGAAVALLLERASDDTRPRVLGRLAGFGLAGDGSGPGGLLQDPTGWRRSFTAAHASAGMSSAEVDVVVAAACGRHRIDDVERSALERSGHGSTPLVAPKRTFGDPSASSALLGVAGALWMMQEGTIPGGGPRPFHAPLGWVEQDMAADVETALVSSYEVGGNYQSVIVRAP